MTCTLCGHSSNETNAHMRIYTVILDSLRIKMDSILLCWLISWAYYFSMDERANNHLNPFPYCHFIEVFISIGYAFIHATYCCCCSYHCKLKNECFVFFVFYSQIHTVNSVIGQRTLPYLVASKLPKSHTLWGQVFSFLVCFNLVCLHTQNR